MGAARRGSALIMAIVIAAVLAVVATAFIVTVRVEHKAATNALRGLQAEAACRAGLAAAVGRIALCYSLEQTANAVYSVDTLGSWHEYFYSDNADKPDFCQDLCPDTWVAHYDATFAKRGMKGKRFLMPVADAGDPAAALKRQKGFTAEYYVAVADLGGKLHVNPGRWDAKEQTPGDLKLLTELWAKPLLLDSHENEIISGMIDLNAAKFYSIGELISRYANSKPGDPITRAEANVLEGCLRVHPLGDALDQAADEKWQWRAININTAKKQTIEAILSQVPALKAAGHVADLATYLDTMRKTKLFAGRRALEDAIYDIAPAGANKLPSGEKLSEKELNDVLNSLNYKEPSIYASDGDVSADPKKSGTSGVYEVKFKEDPPGTWSYEAQSGGEKTSDQASATWGTEVKFASRFFHIYVLGRTTDAAGTEGVDKPRRVMAERRLHAVYDARDRKVLWQRRHFYPKANMADN